MADAETPQKTSMSSCISAQDPTFCLQHCCHFNCFSSDNISSCKSA